MLTGNIICISLGVILLVGIKSTNAKVLCLVCPVIRINLTTDAELNIEGCTSENAEMCSLTLRIDYTNDNNSFAMLVDTQEELLVLTNGQPQVTESTFIWFNELRVQRMASIICFAGASCGYDNIREIYKDEFRPFDFASIQNRLSEQLYSPSPSSSLTCADPSGSPVACLDGFCRSIFDGNGLVTYSTCVKKGLVPNPYGLTVAKVTMADLGGTQVSIIFTCNKPMCNSKEATQQVIHLLVAAQVIPEPTTTTTVIPLTTRTTTEVVPTGMTTTTEVVPTGMTTTTTVAPTVITTTVVDPTAVTTTTTVAPTGIVSSTITTPGPKNTGIKMFNSEQTLLVSSFLFFSLFKIFN